MNHEIQQQIIALLVELGYAPWQLTPATRFAEDLHLDWPRRVKMVERLEQHFGFDVADPELHAMRTLRDACACVERHLLGYQSPFGRLLGLLSLS